MPVRTYIVSIGIHRTKLKMENVVVLAQFMIKVTLSDD